VSKPADYDKNVFINCPFDDQYKQLFDATVFAVHDCGFRARSAREIDDAMRARIDKIVRLISECRLGIHDISRTELDEDNGLPRFNMPLELGIFLGAARLGTQKQRRKNCLILDCERYRYQKFCSDIAGQDIHEHGNDPDKLIKEVRNWLRAVDPGTMIPGAKKIAQRYQQFLEDLPDNCKALHQDIEELTYNDLTTMVASWIDGNPW
jgi:hypothetical protein